MKLTRPLFILSLIFGLCSIETEQHSAVPLVLSPTLLPVFLATAVATPYVAAPSAHKLLLLQILALNRHLLLGASAVAVGALVAGSGGGILAAQLGALALAKHLDFKPLKADYHWCREHYDSLHYTPGPATTPGWGWEKQLPPVLHQNLRHRFRHLRPVRNFLVVRCFARLFNQWARDQSVRLLKKGVRNLRIATNHVRDAVRVVNKEHRQVAKLRPYQGLRVQEAFRGLGNLRQYAGSYHHHRPVVVESPVYGHSHGHDYGDTYGPSYATYGEGAHGASHSDYGHGHGGYTETHGHDTGSYGGHDETGSYGGHDETGSYGGQDDWQSGSYGHDETGSYSHSHAATRPYGRGYSYEPEVGESEVRPKVVDSEAAGASPKKSKSKSAEPLSGTTEYIRGVLKSATAPISDLFYDVYDILTGADEEDEEALTRTKKKPKKIGQKSGNPGEFPDLNARAAEEFLEQHFEKLKAQNPKEAVSMIQILRSAYKQTLTDLDVDGEDKVPNFVPMPAPEKNTREWWNDYLKPQDILNLPTTKNSSSTDKNIQEILQSIAQTAQKPKPKQKVEDDDDDESESDSAADWEAAMVTVSSEVQQYFMLLSSFDNETCFEKLVCDVHTRINESPENFTPYENNVLAVFTLLKTEFSQSLNDPTSQKYLKAAEFGEKNLSSDLCQLKYPTCRYSTNDVMEMGTDLESKSTFSVKDYLMKRLKLSSLL